MAELASMLSGLVDDDQLRVLVDRFFRHVTPEDVA